MSGVGKMVNNKCGNRFKLTDLIPGSVLVGLWATVMVSSGAGLHGYYFRAITLSSLSRSSASDRT